MLPDIHGMHKKQTANMNFCFPGSGHVPRCRGASTAVLTLAAAAAATTVAAPVTELSELIACAAGWKKPVK